MRLLTLVHSLGHGGTQRCAVNYSIGYQRHGHEVAVLGFWGGGELEAELDAARIPVFAGGGDDSERERAVGAGIEWRPELLHVHRPGISDAFGPVIERFAKSGARVIETNVFSRPDYSAAARHIALHLHPSRWCLWKWLNWSRNLRPQPLGVVVPYMVDTERFYPDRDAGAAFREQHGIPKDSILLGRIGQALSAKWSSHMIDTFAALASDVEHLRLLVIGAPPGIRNHIAELPAEIQRRVISLGLVSGYAALRAAYAAMDVFLHVADIGESFGMVLGEAMACGVPVVTLATPVKDNSQMEVVEHGRTGLVAADAGSLLEAVRLLIRDSETRERLRSLARESVVRRYSPAAVMPLLQRVVSLVTTARDRDHLALLLQGDASLTSRVSRADIDRILGSSMGQFGWRQRALMHLVHQPTVYRAYRGFRTLASR